MPPSEARVEEPDDDDGDFFEGIMLDDTEIEYETVDDTTNKDYNHGF